MKLRAGLAALSMAGVATLAGPGPAFAGDAERYKLAADLPDGQVFPFEMIDKRPTPVAAAEDSADFRVVPEDRFADDPLRFVHLTLVAKLSQTGEDRAAVERIVAQAPLALHGFRLELVRSYPNTGRFTRAAGQSGQGLLGVLIGAIMDGVDARMKMSRIATIRIVVALGEKRFEGSSSSSYEESELEAVVMRRAEYAIDHLVGHVLSEVRDRARALAEGGATAARKEVAPVVTPPPGADRLPATERADAASAASSADGAR